MTLTTLPARTGLSLATPMVAPSARDTASSMDRPPWRPTPARMRSGFCSTLRRRRHPGILAHGHVPAGLEGPGHDGLAEMGGRRPESRSGQQEVAFEGLAGPQGRGHRWLGEGQGFEQRAVGLHPRLGGGGRVLPAPGLVVLALALLDEPQAHQAQDGTPGLDVALRRHQQVTADGLPHHDRAVDADLPGHRARIWLHQLVDEHRVEGMRAIGAGQPEAVDGREGGRAGAGVDGHADTSNSGGSGTSSPGWRDASERNANACRLTPVVTHSGGWRPLMSREPPLAGRSSSASEEQGRWSQPGGQSKRLQAARSDTA